MVTIQRCLVHEILPTGEPDDQSFLQLELVSKEDSVHLVITFNDAEQKKKWQQQISSTKLHLQEEELQKKNIGSRPKRRPALTKGGVDLRSLDGTTSLRGPQTDQNALKTVGGGGLKRAVGNIDAFRAMNLTHNQQLNSNPSIDISIVQAPAEAENDSLGLEKLKRAVEAEEEKRDKLQKEILELEAHSKGFRAQLDAQLAKNAELEQAIAEWNAKGGRH